MRRKSWRKTAASSVRARIANAITRRNNKMDKEKTTLRDIVIEEYKDSVNCYLRNGCTEFHRGVTIGIENVLEHLGVTPFEKVRIYNEIWQPWYDEVKNDPNVKKHFRIENTPFSDISKPIFEECNCDECEARRKEIRRRNSGR